MGVMHVDVQPGQANISVTIKAFHHGATIPRDKNTVNGIVRVERHPLPNLAYNGGVGVMLDTSSSGGD